MYNPNSVYYAIARRKLDSYWKNTSAFGTINTFITMNYEGLKDDIMQMLSGERVYVNVNTFQNDLSIISSKDEALTALIHLGYLAYDAENCEAFIPNFEVVDTAIRQINDKGYTGVLADYKGNVLLVGISYNKKTKKHSCRIEKRYDK